MNVRAVRKGVGPGLVALALSQIGLSHGQTLELSLASSRTLTWPPQWVASPPPPTPAVQQPSPLALKNSGALRRRPTIGVALSSPPATAHWASQAQLLLPGQSACEAASPPDWSQLSLSDALAMSLCKSPSLRQALASVTEQTAGLAVVQAAQRPQWSANVNANSSRTFGSSATTSSNLATTVDLSWVLFDFGQSDANLTQARQTLAAAMATQSNSLLEAVRELIQLYGDAVVADAARSATTEAENTATITANVAQGRYEAGVGNQIERLQAQTALAQATLARVRAESDWENARGKLALALGADIAQPIRLSNWEQWSQSSNNAPELANLRSEAQTQHPRLQAARADIKALTAQLQSLDAINKGSVSLSASGGNTRNWVAGASGGNTNSPSGSIGLIATLPLFNARASQAQQAQVVAQIDAREAELEALQREIDSLLWQAHRAVITSAQNAQASERLLAAASNTYEVAQGRYKAGVGSVVDLLTAQSALADARLQRVSAQVEQLSAHTQLSLAAGRIGF